MWFSASAPGSLMLFGEHAVLAGHPAIVAAVDQRVQLQLRPRRDGRIYLQSNLFAPHATSINDLTVVAPYQFVLAILLRYQQQLPSGCDLIIETTFSDQIGFGSSAAVTAATLAAMHTWLNLSLQPADLIAAGVDIIRQVQGVGSGADLAAAVAGKVILYQPTDLQIAYLPHHFQLLAVYAGYKTKTVAVIQHVQRLFAGQIEKLNAIYAAIGASVNAAASAFVRHDWQAVGEQMAAQQKLMVALQVSDTHLNNLVSMLAMLPEMRGAKISGSGLGDCVIGLGEWQSPLSLPAPHQAIAIQIAEQGVLSERHE